MKYIAVLLTSALALTSYAQDRPQRGPYNTRPGGVIDGVALQDEVPVRSKVEYEYVRASDVAWQKRVFSRIDAREIMNHDIFLPYDWFDYSELEGSTYKPKSAAEIDDQTWLKDDKRWSLWTVIQRHIMLGDLTVYRVNSPDFKTGDEDGYSLKYPISRTGQNDYFESKAYKDQVNAVMTCQGNGEIVTIARPISEDTWMVERTKQTLDEFLDSLDARNPSSDYEELGRRDFNELKRLWDQTEVGAMVRNDRITMYLNSSNIVAYHIKEDWYFDKERSVLDKRIIAIAPVARYSEATPPGPGELSTRGELLFFNEKGTPLVLGNGGFQTYDKNVVELEMFWLYFDELRNVLVNYYVFNDKNDAQWMSFDDLFWKRKFSSTIYKVSDKFDREIEDYKFGVEALYESEKVKESIRNWEHDLWNY
jgi:Gliding motility associated protein GldN